MTRLLPSVTNTDFYGVGGQKVDDAFIKTGKPKYVHWERCAKCRRMAITSR